MAGVGGALVAVMGEEPECTSGGCRARSAEEHFRVRELIEVHRLRAGGGLRQGHRHHLGALQADHRPEAALADEIRRFRKPVSTTWLADETYVKILGKWHYLYRGVDQDGQVLDCWLSRTLHALHAHWR